MLSMQYRKEDFSETDCFMKNGVNEDEIRDSLRRRSFSLPLTMSFRMPFLGVMTVIPKSVWLPLQSLSY